MATLCFLEDFTPHVKDKAIFPPLVWKKCKDIKLWGTSSIRNRDCAAMTTRQIHQKPEHGIATTYFLWHLPVWLRYAHRNEKPHLPAFGVRRMQSRYDDEYCLVLSIKPMRRQSVSLPRLSWDSPQHIVCLEWSFTTLIHSMWVLSRPFSFNTRGFHIHTALHEFIYCLGTDLDKFVCVVISW